MREFKATGATLHRLSAPAKALYASFNLLTIAGFATSLALYWDSMGFTPSSAATWYLGNAEDPAAAEIILDKSPRQLLEITHQHLFSMPVVMLVLAHLFLLSRGDPRFKAAVALAAPVLTAAHVAGPWIIHYGGPAFGWVMPVTAVPYLAVYLILALWPIPDLLRSAPTAE